MNVLVLDDEKITLGGIVRTINECYPDYEVAGYTDVESAYDYVRKNKVQIALLDIEMGRVNGISVARRLMNYDPDIKIIFITAYEEYMSEAFYIHADGYITKPLTKEKLTHEIDYLTSKHTNGKRVKVRTFGDFEVFIDGQPVVFSYNKTKELFAFLIDNRGCLCTVGKIISYLFEDGSITHASYVRNLISDMKNTLEKYGCEDILMRSKGVVGIEMAKVDCDYFNYLAGNSEAVQAFKGEYMNQYSWADETLSKLL